MKTLTDLISRFGPDSYVLGNTTVRIEREAIRIQFREAQRMLENARSALELDGHIAQKPTSLVLDERINLESIGCRYALVHPTTLKESTIKLHAQEKGLTPDLIEHMQHQALERLVYAFAKNKPVEPPKLSDYLAYASDLVYSTAVYIKDSQGRVLLQQRSANETSYPLHWQPSANGKLENYQEALKREIGEELGEAIQKLNLPVTLVSETPYLLVKKGVEKPAIGRDYVAEIGNLDIAPLITISPETEKCEFVTKEDILSGRIIPLSVAKKTGATPQTHIIMFDDQYASLRNVMGLHAELSFQEKSMH